MIVVVTLGWEVNGYWVHTGKKTIKQGKDVLILVLETWSLCEVPIQKMAKYEALSADLHTFLWCGSVRIVMAITAPNGDTNCQCLTASCKDASPCGENPVDEFF